MNDRLKHEWIYDGPSGLAGSGQCRICRQSDEAEGAGDECPVRLRAALDEARAAERARIVSWIREQDASGCIGSTRESDAAQWIANRIESGRLDDHD